VVWLDDAFGFARDRQRLSDDLLGQAARVRVGGVDEVDAGIEGHRDLPSGAIDIGISDDRCPARSAEGHRAKGEGRDSEPRPAELPIFHAAILPH